MTIRFVRQSLFPALAAGLLGLLVGTALWSGRASAADAAASDFSQTPPPGQPSATVADTEHSTRLYGNNPYEEAVAVTRHTYTASQPVTAPTEKNNAADRPWGLTLVTPDDPIAAISAVELVHFPDNAPIMFVDKTGIPAVTLNEIKRLQPVGIARDNNVQAFLVGAAANSAVQNQLNSLGLKYQTVTAPNDFELANQIDMAYGKIQNPPSGVPQMEGSATFGGNGIQDVFIGSTSAYQFMLPITHWVSHMPGGVFWVDPKASTLPESTIAGLKRRMGHATIYVGGGPEQVPDALVSQLQPYGAVTRLTNDDAVAFNTPPPITAESTAVAFSQMWDPVGMVGWNAVGAGHGFTIVNINDWQGAVGSAILSHLGFHAPLLLTDSATTLPADVTTYLQKVAPTFLVSPGDGPYNMLYVIGNYDKVSWNTQVTAQLSQEMGNRHDSPGGSVYIPPR
jgi:hypothetical protein